MRALTVRQPYAWAIMHGGKTVENRTRAFAWRRGIGQRLAIHAGARLHMAADTDDVLQAAIAGHTLPGDHLPDAAQVRSAVLGTVLLTGVHEAATGCCQPWGHPYRLEPGPGYTRALYDVVHLTFEDPRPLAVPIPLGGRLGLWTVPPDVEARLASYSRVHLARPAVEA